MIKGLWNPRPRMMATGAEPPDAKRPTLGGLTSSIGRHAESLIAISLIGVVAVVAATAWLLQLRDEKAARSESAPPPAELVEQAPAADEENAAAVAWAEELEGEMAEMQQQEDQLAEQKLREQQLARERQAAAQAARSAAAPATPAKAPPAVAAPAPLSRVKVARARLNWKSCKPPAYPASSNKRREEGITVMSFQVDARGKVMQHRIDKSSGSTTLDRAAAGAIAKCSFTPETADGQPRASWAQVRFTWKLED